MSKKNLRLQMSKSNGVSHRSILLILSDTNVSYHPKHQYKKLLRINHNRIAKLCKFPEVNDNLVYMLQYTSAVYSERQVHSCDSSNGTQNPTQLTEINPI